MRREKRGSPFCGGRLRSTGRGGVRALDSDGASIGLTEAEAAVGKTLTLHTGGNWAGALPGAIGDLNHECADDINSYLYPGRQRETRAEGEPVGPGPLRHSRSAA